MFSAVCLASMPRVITCSILHSSRSYRMYDRSYNLISTWHTNLPSRAIDSSPWNIIVNNNGPAAHLVFAHLYPLSPSQSSYLSNEICAPLPDRAQAPGGHTVTASSDYSYLAPRKRRKKKCFFFMCCWIWKQTIYLECKQEERQMKEFGEEIMGRE